MSRSSLWFAIALTGFAALARAEPIVIEGTVPDDEKSFVRLPFDVPAGTAEIQIHHVNPQNQNVLDWGLRDQADKFRGWGGGNSEDIVINAHAASRSYLPGPIQPGQWSVVLGKAKIVEKPASYRVEITLRDTVTLPAQTERRPFQVVPALKTEARWYAGDFHVHSRESGDANATLDEIATLAKKQGLDFVEISDHNTTSHLDYLGAAQDRHPDLLFLPGVEFTTYAGHANGIGATQRVDHEFDLFPQYGIADAVTQFRAQGALFSINHPALDLKACIGCSWKHDLDPNLVDAVEVETSGWQEAGQFFTEAAIAFWDEFNRNGRHIAAIGGSDDHTAGKSSGSPIGSPTTLVFARELSLAGIQAGIREGRTVVKLQAPSDPMVTIHTADGKMIGDTVQDGTELIFTVTGGAGGGLRIYHNGDEVLQVPVTSDPFEYRMAVPFPSLTEDRWRAAAIKDDHLATVTSHIWVTHLPIDYITDDESRCGCTAASGTSLALLALGLISLRRRLRR
jgi:hypothetical protein